MYPDDLHYTKEHEWIRIAAGVGTVGITQFAQDELGEVVYVELPRVGDKFDQGDTFGNVESVKAVSELFVPVAGEVVEVNEGLTKNPELVNDDPYGKAWMIKLRMTNAKETAGLLSAKEYEAYIAEKEGE